MSKTKLIATIIVATLLGITMFGIKHIKNLDNQIQFKKIQLLDNSAKLKLLDKKYTDLNSELNKKDADKAKIEQDLKNLQKERDELQAQLQAKLDSKNKDLATRATQAIGAPQTVYASPIGDTESIIRQAALKYGVDPNYLVNIARCESGLRSDAIAPNFIAGSHPSGLFQHVAVYWPARAEKYGYAGASVFDVTAQANVTAQMFRDGLQGLWECK